MRILLQFAKKKSHASVQEGGQVEESSPKTAFVWQAWGVGSSEQEGMQEERESDLWL